MAMDSNWNIPSLRILELNKETIGHFCGDGHPDIDFKCSILFLPNVSIIQYSPHAKAFRAVLPDSNFVYFVNYALKEGRFVYQISEIIKPFLKDFQKTLSPSEKDKVIKYRKGLLSPENSQF